jgi:MoaA/NifB/PqqE/SkfB family radical SAM enzyme
VTRFGISIHSDQAKIENSLTRVKNAFERKVKGLKNLVKIREAGRVPDNVSVNPLLHTKILKRMPQMLRFFLGLGIDDVRFNSLRPVTGGKEDRALCPSFRQAMPRVVEIIRQNEQELGLHLTFGDIPCCAWPWQFLANRYLVERYVGEHHDLETSVAIFRDAKSDQKLPERFVWADVKREELKAKLPVCDSCAWGRRCEGYWKTYLQLHGTGEIAPPQGVYP